MLKHWTNLINLTIEMLSTTREDISRVKFGRIFNNAVLQIKIEASETASEKVLKAIKSLDLDILSDSEISDPEFYNFTCEITEIVKYNYDFAMSVSNEFRLNILLEHFENSGPHLPPSVEIATAARDWWSEVFDVLSASYEYNRHQEGYRPFEVALSDISFRYIMFAVDELRRGNVPAGISRVQGSGAPSLRGDLRNYIRMANEYVRECKRGRIDDQSPFETVSSSFGVTTKNARRWWKNEKRYESAYFKRTKSIEKIVKNMRDSGERYRERKNLRPQKN